MSYCFISADFITTFKADTGSRMSWQIGIGNWVAYSMDYLWSQVPESQFRLLHKSRVSLSRAQVRKEREKAWLALALAWVAGDIDAIGYLVLFHLFTAHMSGNSVGMGLYLGQQQWGEALHRAFPIPMFIFGIALSTVLTEIVVRRGTRSSFALLIGIEAILLLIFLLFGSQVMHDGSISAGPLWEFYTLAALPAIAMGIQSATLRRVGGQTIHTTYVTGMLTRLTEEATLYALWLHDHLRRKSQVHLGKLLRVSSRQQSLNRALLFGGIWSSYIVGAIIGGYTELHWGLWSVAESLCVLSGLIVVDLIWPIAPLHPEPHP